MSRHTRPPQAELARLADGSLPAAERPELLARIKDSPALAQELADQEQVVAMLRSVDEVAPAALRAQIEAMEASSRALSHRPRRFLVAAATGLAILAAAVVALTRVGSSQPSVSQTARLALMSPTTAAPAEDATHRGLLAVTVDRVSFPYWGASFGWRAVGTRTDLLRSRRIVTVLYADPTGARVGYSIVAGTALTTPPGRVVVRHGVRFNLVNDGRVHLITWLRSGHTCILAGAGLGEHLLLTLASGGPGQSASA